MRMSDFHCMLAFSDAYTTGDIVAKGETAHNDYFPHSSTMFSNRCVDPDTVTLTTNLIAEI